MFTKIFSPSSLLAKIFKSDLAKNVSIVSIANIILRIVGFIFTAIVARAINPEGFGQVVIFIALLTTFSQFFDLGLSTTYLKKSTSGNEVYRKIYVYAKMLLHILSIPIVYITLASINSYISLSNTHLFILVLAYMSQSILNLTQTYFQSVGSFYLYALIPLISNIFKLIILYLIFRLNIFNIDYIFLTIMITPIIASIIFLPKIYRDIKNISNEIAIDHIVEVFNTAKWIALSAVATIITMKLDVFFLAYFSSDEELGLYGVANQFASAISLLSISLTAVLLPKFSGAKDKELLDNFKKIITMMFLPILFIFLISLPLIDFFVVIIFGEAYQVSSFPAKILIFGALISLLANQLGILYLAKDTPQILTRINFMQLIIMCIFCYFLVPSFGGIGAAISMLIIRVFMAIYVILDLKNN